MSDALISLGPRRVARVAVDLGLPHLDRLFDYEVPEAMDAEAVPGARVQVSFAGQQCDGFIVERATESDLDQLAKIRRVVSPEAVLTPGIAELIRKVADHYGGTFSDVARLAVPPRHARTEKASHEPCPRPTPEVVPGPWAHYQWGDSFLSALERGDSPRAAWACVPVASEAGDWATAWALAALATRRSGRGSILLAPDGTALEQVGEACNRVLGVGSWVMLTAQMGPAERYRSFLAALRGEVDVVVGTRSAVWAPVHRLGLVALWDDGDDSWAEERTPGFHAREVAALRGTGCGLLFGAHARTAEVEALVERGWMSSLAMIPDDARRVGPLVRAAVDSDFVRGRDPLAAASRLPSAVFTTIKEGLARGPVLVQVPRTGGRLSLACDTGREPARCAHCGGPLVEPTDDGQLSCQWCARPVARAAWRCPECGGERLRSRTVGASRTATELGRAFPGVRLISSTGAKPVSAVDAEPALVVATPGVEPLAQDGYAAAILLDGDALLGRADLRAAEEALRRWSAAAALVRPASAGGTVVVSALSSARAVQALIRHDPVGFASRELADRAAAAFPPAVKMVSIEGDPTATGDIVSRLTLPEGAEVLGPVPVPLSRTARLAAEVDEYHRYLLRAPVPMGRELVAAVRTQVVRRSADKAPGSVKVRVDPAIIV